MHVRVQSVPRLTVLQLWDSGSMRMGQDGPSCSEESSLRLSFPDDSPQNAWHSKEETDTIERDDRGNEKTYTVTCKR